ncbi:MULTISPECIES: carbohydrate ABC transporter permease [unclassified Paenibacillus]|uniref:carbohydrate ABC transporter permease n=1 Tax=unclassified Paenibacillus TaxID=185978 RepID=UPI0009A6C92C|nr:MULTISPECIES: carbohydrate ABC transporter permease [unclassified Paenibacillus]SLJ88382.1 carbohydrate ABC transporter membrane protein 2, CUT1 family [Paenibacillus sp. RU5A]SOC63886.1 carbohydrate ABC transporter membrane protein 2, CUT1 family [Paenibacillus sp. RU26A]SOC68563.1 carbohydrate ABC transporter membrane protein 2, CUT1 family [Paenibacillus sp. RU5M]
MKRNNTVKKIFIAVVSLIICLIPLIPFYMMINISLKDVTDYKSTISIPKEFVFANFVDAWKSAGLGTAFMNNIIITIFTLLLVILVSSMASYPLSRNKSKLNKAIYTTFIACMIIPSLTLIVPLYMILIKMHALNTLWGAILVQTAFSLPMSIFLYTGFISSIPKELDEAGYIDGASRIGIFFKLILPLLKPITASVVILQGVGIWNEYGMSLYILQNKDVQNLTVALSRFVGQYQSQMNWVAAGCLMSAAPMIVLFLIFQKQFIKGISSGAVKG